LAVDPPCRDRTLWPFSSNSIWNTPVGSNAQYVPGQIYVAPFGAPASFHNDQDFFVVADSSDPLTPWVNQGSWTGVTCSPVTGEVADHIHVPHNFITDCIMNNNAAGFLMPDNHTLIQMQPLYRQTPGSPILALWHQGGPVPFPWEIDILGDGALGAHGGSGLSAVGGTIRLGELLPTTGPIRHALKLELYAGRYYYYNESNCFTWPATGCDGYAASGYHGTNPYMKPGALLAIPPSVAPSVIVTTIPGSKIKQALIDYGGYLVDDTANSSGSICMESAVNDELENQYKFSVRIQKPVTPTQSGEFFNDLVNIFKALHIIINNTEKTIGGGGTPIAPLAPPICGV